MQWFRHRKKGSLATHINVSHMAPTPPGLSVSVECTLTEVEGRRLVWDVVAHDGVHEIGRGSHQHAVINLEKFNAKVAEKKAAALGK